MFDGGTVSDAATAAGVSRQTTSEWRNRNHVFIAVLNAGRLDVVSHDEDRLRRLLGKSLDVIEAQVEAGDVSTAKLVLRTASKLNLNKVGPTKPQLVKNEMQDKEDAIMWEQLSRLLAADQAGDEDAE